MQDARDKIAKAKKHLNDLRRKATGLEALGPLFAPQLVVYADKIVVDLSNVRDHRLTALPPLTVLRSRLSSYVTYGGPKARFELSKEGQVDLKTTDDDVEHLVRSYGSIENAEEDCQRFYGQHKDVARALKVATDTAQRAGNKGFTLQDMKAVVEAYLIGDEGAKA